MISLYYEPGGERAMPKAAYVLTHPERRTTSVVFASPHSGRDYPWSFLRRTALNATRPIRA